MIYFWASAGGTRPHIPLRALCLYIGDAHGVGALPRAQEGLARWDPTATSAASYSRGAATWDGANAAAMPPQQVSGRYGGSVGGGGGRGLVDAPAQGHSLDPVYESQVIALSQP